MNRVLEKVFPTFSRHVRPRGYYTYPEGSTASNVVFRVVNGGADAVVDGRVVLFLAPTAEPAPRLEAFDLESPRPLFAKDVRDLQPGEAVEFESTEFTIPGSLGFVPSDLSAFSTELYVQALISKDVNDPDANTCVGSLYSIPQKVTLEGANTVVTIDANQVISSKMDVSSSEWVECVEMKSEVLSEYHQQDVSLYAALVLPHGYHKRASNTKYPTVYYIEGFTGTESYADRAHAFLNSEMGEAWKQGHWPVPMIRITLGSRFKFGHTSFADSESNGPWGTALVTEFIPYLESKFPMIAASTARFLHGHSSGGWSTLWLQVQNPSFFGGTWSSAPDPVDFHFFQAADIYTAPNLYWDEYGRLYPTSRCDGAVTATSRDENLVERVYARGNGGQWDAFIALFSPRDSKTGMPIPLFDKLSGVVNPAVAEYWTKYDIKRILESKWATLGPQLVNKVHVICGDEDTYYLDRACRSLQQLIGAKKDPKTASIASYVDLVPGDHYSIRNRAHYQLVYEEIALAFNANH